MDLYNQGQSDALSKLGFSKRAGIADALRRLLGKVDIPRNPAQGTTSATVPSERPFPVAEMISSSGPSERPPPVAEMIINSAPAATAVKKPIRARQVAENELR